MSSVAKGKAIWERKREEREERERTGPKGAGSTG